MADGDTGSTAPSDVKVLYIVGWGGSGSTIIDNVMGQLPGFCSTGELHALWEGLAEGRHRCGCGVWVGECPFWRSVLEVGFGGRVDPALVVDWQRRAMTMRHIGRVMWAMRRGAPAWEPLRAYSEVSARLYRAVAEVSGSRVVVDSSKVPSHAALLAIAPGITPYLLHLVRDPRGVAFSWRRRGSFGPAGSTSRWSIWNVATEVIRLRLGPGRSLLVRYEDFVADPGGSLRGVARFLGEDPAGLPLVGLGEVRLRGNHTVSGNRSRFETGTIAVRADDEWSEALPPADRAISTALALPLLPRYAYPIRVARPRHRAPGTPRPR